MKRYCDGTYPYSLFLAMALGTILLFGARSSLADGPCISFEHERTAFVGGTAYEVWAHLQPWACPAGLCWSVVVPDGVKEKPVYCPAFPKKILGANTEVTINISIKSGGAGYPVMYAPGCDVAQNISSAQEGQTLYSRDCKTW